MLPEFQQTTSLANSSVQNRYPLKVKPYLPLPLGVIKPGGWLGKQLHLMRDGLTGNLDTIYKEVLGERNGWLGGDGDVWERGPYWLDGLVPLAYILQDERLMSKAQPWIEWAIASQKEDGYFGPHAEAGTEQLPEAGLQKDKAADWWPRMVMLKVLQQYYSATGDSRVIGMMQRYFRYQLANLPRFPLGHWSWWGEQRGGDNLAVVLWLYNITGDAFLLELADLIHKQTFDWTETFLHSDELSKSLTLHGVNVAQAIKEPVVYYQRAPEEKYIEAVSKGLGDLEYFHGQAHGVFSGDELLHGTSPEQGVELCTVVELMFSLETIMAITGEVSSMDHLERIAFNSLPAQTTSDYKARQYYQQANQVLVSRNRRNFDLQHGDTDLCFGILTGYPCCTVNMHQAWPKYVQSLWHATSDNGLAALVYGASEVTAAVADGVMVTFVEETEYPFDDKITFRLRSDEAVHFPLHLRIPGWCENAVIMVNGTIFMEAEGNRIVKMARRWTDGDEVTLQLPMRVVSKRRHDNSVAVECGPLVYALKIVGDWRKVENTDSQGPFHEIRPISPWNYGMTEEIISKLADIEPQRHPAMGFPWTSENAPVSLNLLARRLPDWQVVDHSAGPFPQDNQRHDRQADEHITLIPYGCTKLRITEFPVIS